MATKEPDRPNPNPSLMTPSHTKLMEQSIRDEIKYGMASLSPREIQVVSAYFGIDQTKPMNLEEIGDMFGLTRERVRQIKDRALRRIKKTMINNNPQAYSM